VYLESSNSLSALTSRNLWIKLTSGGASSENGILKIKTNNKFKT
jgi:hypothetical protein